ncbi:MAG: LysR family transcriptional regulator [Sulfitobacter sp.]
MDNWDEFRTAYHVARLGTVSGAADVLGVHHATVIRHIDALEARLGVKLFQRHARGYTPTEAGEDLLRVAAATDDQLNQLVGRIKGQGTEVSGELVVTSLRSLAPSIAPLLSAFQVEHPGVVIRYLTGDRLFRLEYGEAHVAIRAGVAPDQPDNVVQKLMELDVGAYASRDYVARFGQPANIAEFENHCFIAHDECDNRAPFYQWLRQNVSESRIRFRSDDNCALEAAVKAGAGIGFLPQAEAINDPELIEIHPPMAVWSAPLWLVTHVDLHRTNKVQTLLAFLKTHVKSD